VTDKHGTKKERITIMTFLLYVSGMRSFRWSLGMRPTWTYWSGWCLTIIR